MSKQLEKMYMDIFSDRGVVPCETIPEFGVDGEFYKMSPESGKGYCWVYRCNPYVTITIMNQIHYEDTYCAFEQPNYLCVGYFYSVSGEILTPYQRLTSGTIQSYVGEKNEYRMILHKNVPVDSISITFMPEYYKKYLSRQYPIRYEKTSEAFKQIDGRHDLPELIMVFNQIKNYKGDGLSAKLFYESKANEVLSIILDKTKKLKNNKNDRKPPVSDKDLEAVISVSNYINDHYAESIRMDFLSKIACMSQAKLKYTFKNVYHMNVRQYIVTRRITYAERLLKDTDLPISQIAEMVGYRHISSLSNMFKQHTGMKPTDYRVKMKTEDLRSSG